MAHLLVMVQFLFVFHVNMAHAVAINQDSVTAITSFMIHNHAMSSVIFGCWKKADTLRLSSGCSAQGLRLQIHVPDSDIDAALLLRATFYPVAVIVDMTCEASSQLLQMASRQRLFSRLHYWLLLSEDKPSNSVLESAYLPLDSHVTVSYREIGWNQTFLQDIYHVGVGQSLTITPPRYWNPGMLLPAGPRRTNYGGITIPTVTVLAEGTWENFLDFQYRHINTDSKVQYIFMSHIANMLNFRMKVCLTNTWGYPINGSKCFNGAVGLLQCGSCEVGATGLLFKSERMAVIDYAGETLLFRGAFMFLKPSLSEVSVIYELPFNTSVWITYAGTVAILTVVLMITRRVHQRVDTSSSGSPVGWGDSIMDSLAVVCQQDALHSPKNISSRIVFFFMLLLTVFIITSYSATIVSLLQTSSNAINTLQDLMKSPLKLSMIDIFVNETTDPEITRVFKEKLYTQPFKEAFTTESVGMEKIRRGLFAYHGFTGAYKIISDKYEDHEKCRLKEIKMFTSLHLCFTARKGSPYTPHIKERTCWLREVGLIDREDKLWFYHKPKCETAGQNFVSVGIQEFYPALVVLAYGIGGCVGILIAEILFFRRQQAICCALSFTNNVTIIHKNEKQTVGTDYNLSQINLL